ncbi:MAG: STAS domain-containing protein [Bacteroidota bacterium]
MKYSIDKQEQYSVFELQEEKLDSVIAPDLKSQFIIMKNEGTANLIFDLSAVKYVDSSGLSAILTGNRLWKGDGVFILACVDSPSIQKLIEISRLQTILTIMPTVDEGVDFVLMEEIEKDLNKEES